MSAARPFFLTLSQFARLTAAMTFVLLIAGGLVTSTDSGLSVPDWPLSYGGLFPPMVGGIRYEHTHRLIAGTVAILIFVLAARLRRRESRRWVRGLGDAAATAVLAQALLGGLTVIWLLPPAVSVAHACLGQTVFCLVVSIALLTSRTWQTSSVGRPDAALRRMAGATTAVIFVQLLLGAVIRHSGRGLPAHLVGAVTVSTMVAVFAWRVRRSPARTPLLAAVAWIMALGVVGQLGLGLGVLGSRQAVAITTAHVALGALILASACMVTWLLCRAEGFFPLVSTSLATPEPA